MGSRIYGELDNSGVVDVCSNKPYIFALPDGRWGHINHPSWMRTTPIKKKSKVVIFINVRVSRAICKINR